MPGLPFADRAVVNNNAVVLDEFQNPSPAPSVSTVQVSAFQPSQAVNASGNSGSISIARESGQYYIVYKGVKHSVASSEFAYFDLSLTDVNKAVPDSDMLRLPEGDPFNEFAEEDKAKMKKVFLEENIHGLKALPRSPDLDYK